MSVKQHQEDKEISVSDHIFNVENDKKIFSYFIKFSYKNPITGQLNKKNGLMQTDDILDKLSRYVKT